MQLSTYLFIDIPGFARAFPERPFVSIDIQALFVQYLSSSFLLQRPMRNFLSSLPPAPLRAFSPAHFRKRVRADFSPRP